MILSIALVALVGFALSLYGYFVELKVEQNGSYKPVCDLNDRFSCSKPITSGYGRLLFSISNMVVGMAFYGLVFVLALLGMGALIFWLACGALVVCVGLAYILYFKVHSICLLCHAIYVVNILLFILSLKYR